MYLLQNLQLLITVFILGTVLNRICAHQFHDYIVIGAGPAGLQLGYFLQQAKRDYVILERANVSGNFFTVYPRHNRLISINKRNTGKTNKEFNLRHDWNSLLSHDESLLVTKYSKQFFPPKDSLVRYLNDYQQKLGINVKHNSEISNIHKDSSGGEDLFFMQDQNGNTFSCKTLILATGMWKPNIVRFEGMEYAEGYEDMNIDPEEYEGKTVLILGRGNTAFEVADSIYGNTNLIHMIARSRIKLSWATHYVGDLRAVNNGLLDTYQLKSLDGILEAPMEEAKITKKESKFFVRLQRGDQGEESELYDNFALREGYDKIIRCLGFKFDDSIFNQTLYPTRPEGKAKKYMVKLKFNYESENIPGLFVAGTAAHSLDFRKSSGGFIHGFRYTARTLHRLLEWRNHRQSWQTHKGHMTDLLTTFVKRINEASGLYQMFGALVDVAAINDEGTEYEYLEEVPLELIHELPSVTGIQLDRVIVLNMEYGANFSGAGKDTFRYDRAVGEPSEAFKSNFLHPVFYYYKHLPTATDMKTRGQHQALPTPERIHHIVEDFLTLWTASKSHVLPLRRFIEMSVKSDLRSHFAESCFAKALMYGEVPLSCEDGYLNGFGLPADNQLITAAKQEMRGFVPASDI